MIEVQAIEDADSNRMLRPRVLQNNGAEAPLDQIAQLRLLICAGLEPFAVDLGPLVEIDIRGIRIAIAAFCLGDVKKALLGAAAQTLSVHSHVMGKMVLLGRDYARHTRTSSS